MYLYVRPRGGYPLGVGAFPLMRQMVDDRHHVDNGVKARSVPITFSQEVDGGMGIAHMRQLQFCIWVVNELL